MDRADSSAQTLHGCICFDYGPMCAEKGLQAICSALRAARGIKPFREPLWFKPEIDTHADCIRSRIGLSVPAAVLSADVETACAQLRAAFEPPSIICIDEVQFIGIRRDGKVVDERLLWLFLATLIEGMRQGSQIFLAGLDADYRGEPFAFSRLLLLDPRILRRQRLAVCAACSADASMTQRLLRGEPAPRDMPTVVVKDDDASFVSYEPRCAMCHELPD